MLFIFILRRKIRFSLSSDNLIGGLQSMKSTAKETEIGAITLKFGPF